MTVKADTWRLAAEIYRDTGDIMAAYNFMVSFEKKRNPNKKQRSLFGFRIMIRDYAKQFGIDLPDRRRKKQEEPS